MFSRLSIPLLARVLACACGPRLVGGGSTHVQTRGEICGRRGEIMSEERGAEGGAERERVES